MKNKAFSLLELAIVMVIIGLLAVGITAGQRLINKGKLSRARMLTASAPVAGISGLRLWLEPTLADSITEDSNGVLQWNDLSPYNMDAVRVTSGAGPTIIRNGVNNLPSLDVYSRQLKVTNFFPPFKNSTTFVVIDTSGSLAADQYVFLSYPMGSTSAGNRIGLSIFTTTGDFSVQITGDSLYRIYLLNDQYYQNNKSFIIVITTGLGQTAKIYINGILAGTATTATNDNYYGGYDKYLQIGAGSSIPLPPFSGHIAEFIVYDKVLPSDERQEVEEYLSKKYNIGLGS